MSHPGPGDDLIQPFQVETGVLRGRLVRLGPAADTILSRHDYPEPVAVMLGQMLVLAAAIAGAIRFDGLFTLQSQSDGPISMMVVDFASSGEMRGYAKYDEAALRAAERGDARAGASVPRLLGAGHLVITIDFGPETELYQGYVELEGATLAECAHNYFRQSEQLDAALRLAVDRVDSGGGACWRAGGLMVQRMPVAAGRQRFARDEEWELGWRQGLARMGGLRDEELTGLGIRANDVLYRLFHESGVRVFRPVALSVGCRCSRERVRRMLGSFDRAELAGMVVDDRILVTCEFCNAAFAFAEGEIARLARP